MADYVWVSAMDKGTCETCVGLNSEVKSLEEWEAEGVPRVRDTECNGYCRCDLINDSWTSGDIEKEITRAIEDGLDDLVNELLQGIKIDTTRGGFVRDPILLREYKAVKGITTLPLETIADHQELVIEWKRTNNFKKLPDDFLNLSDIQKEIKWLKAN